MTDRGRLDDPWSRLFSIGIDAWYLGEHDLGRQACEQLLSMSNLPEHVRARTLANLAYYAQSLPTLAPGATFTRVPRIEQLGWTWLNPGVITDDDGVHLIVRVSNHVIEPNGWAFIDPHGASRNHNYAVHLDHDLKLRDITVLTDLTAPQDITTYPFIGYEDIRLIQLGDAVYGAGAVRNRTPNGICQQALIRIDDHSYTDCRLLSDETDGHQKNWMPFVLGGELMFVQHCHPLIIRRENPTSGDIVTIAQHDTLDIAQSFRGGSQGVPVEGGTLFVVHEQVNVEEAGRLYLHRLILIDDSLHLSHLSPQFWLTQLGIEYCAGMARLGDDLLISFGINDEEACLARLPLREALALLRPIDTCLPTLPISDLPARDAPRPQSATRITDDIDAPARSGIVSVTLAGHGRANSVGGALASVRDHVDTCLVIDTDRAIDVLQAAQQAAGAKYQQRQFSWCNDFAAARNAALRLAAETGAEWAIMLDTDERLQSNGVDLRAVLATTSWDVLSVEFSGGTYAKPRMFRLPARGEYLGQTHEYFQSTTDQHGILPGVYCQELAKGPDGMQEKLLRDLEILRDHVARHPRNSRWYYYLGETLQSLGDFPAAIEAFDRCATLGGWREEAAWACYRQAECWLNLRAPRQAILSCTTGLACHAGIAELAWLAAHASWIAKEYEQAVHWAHLASTHGYASNTGAPIDRNGFRNPTAQYEGPFDIMRLAYRAMENDAAADEAERDFQQARSIRLERWPVA